MKRIKIYPPKGGQPISCHPVKLDEMIGKGWTLAPVKSTSKPKTEN